MLTVNEEAMKLLYTWLPRLLSNKILQFIYGDSERELHSVVNRYAVAVKKYSGETVGYLFRQASKLYALLLFSCFVTHKPSFQLYNLLR